MFLLLILAILPIFVIRERHTLPDVDMACMNRARPVPPCSTPGTGHPHAGRPSGYMLAGAVSPSRSRVCAKLMRAASARARRAALSSGSTPSTWQFV